MLKSTAAASSGVPSWNFTFGRMWKVYTVPSGETSHEVAKAGRRGGPAARAGGFARSSAKKRLNIRAFDPQGHPASGPLRVEDVGLRLDPDRERPATMRRT